MTISNDDDYNIDHDNDLVNEVINIQVANHESQNPKLWAWVVTPLVPIPTSRVQVMVTFLFSKTVNPNSWVD